MLNNQRAPGKSGYWKSLAHTFARSRARVNDSEPPRAHGLSRRESDSDGSPSPHVVGDCYPHASVLLSCRSGKQRRTRAALGTNATTQTTLAREFSPNLQEYRPFLSPLKQATTQISRVGKRSHCFGRRSTGRMTKSNFTHIALSQSRTRRPSFSG